MATRTARGLDLFCGAGGSSCGARAAGISIVGAVDAWQTAIDTFKLNFPDATTWTRRLELLPPRSIIDSVGKIDILLASPECTNHTHAKGNKRVGVEQEKSRQTANQVVRFAKAIQPRWLVVENVVAMRKWVAYETWKRRLESIGYFLNEIVLDAQDFGVPQSRRRLFVVGDMAGPPSLPSPSGLAPVPVRKILHPEGCNDFSYVMSPVFRSVKKRAEDTLKRIRRAIAELGPNSPFLVVYYGSDAAGGWQRINRPLRTITTLDRFALVKPTSSGHVMRMLQPPELAAAMGFPLDYHWPDVTRRERIKLVGNAVAPPVMKAVVEALIGTSSTQSQRTKPDRQVQAWLFPAK
jgi:DNA (cytosine-5)-methyltransferase 1